MSDIDAYFCKVAKRIPNYSDGVAIHPGISINKKIYGGAPCVGGTRVPIYAILEMVQDGSSHKQILRAFPSIGEEGLACALRYAKLILER